MIGSEGEAAAVDSQRDVDIYLKAANEQNFKIRHLFETHLHAAELPEVSERLAEA
jgi:glyoxylase-like metal-dependent hydrolase (beta-lactamase superfamily II)